MTFEAVQGLYTIINFGLAIVLLITTIIKAKPIPNVKDQEIKYIEYGPEKGRYYKVAYDSANHCYYLMTLEIKDSKTEGREYKDTYFQPQQIIPFWRYKMLGGADKKNREKPAK